MRYLYIIFIIVVSCSLKNNRLMYIYDFKNVVNCWNQSSIESLDNSILFKQNPLYKNRLEAFNSLHSVGDFKNIESTIRYKFLLKIHEDKDLGNDFYIVESNKSGEVYEVRNFLIYKVSDNRFKIRLYDLENSEWKPTTETFFVSTEDNAIQKYKECKIGEGINNDDVILSCFKKRKIIYSEFYLFTTFPKNNVLSGELFNEK